MSDIHPLLAEMQRMATSISKSAPEDQQGDFSALLRQAVEAVNRMQHHASDLAEAFERGSSEVDLVDVVLAKEKAGLAFQTLLQVRNKVIQAYQDIMNMPL